VNKFRFYIGLFCLAFSHSLMGQSDQVENPFLGMWSLDIEHGSVGWLHVYENQDFLDAELMWIGGSVVPVSYAYMADEHTLVLTRSQNLKAIKDTQGKERIRSISHTMRLKKVGHVIAGEMVGPHWRGGEEATAFVGYKLPPLGPAPDLSKVRYGQEIQLFNGKDLTGWRIINPKDKNGFRAQDGELITDPKQPENGEYVHYGNLRTEKEFTDFNLTLEVNVPKENNSGIYLKGMYEVQVYDSYGKDLDSHNMGALYSRITPTINAEKPAGQWQKFDITLLDRHVTVILNGIKIIDNQAVQGPTGGAMISDVFAPGPIYLQGDHGNVKYRNIVIRPIL